MQIFKLIQHHKISIIFYDSCLLNSHMSYYGPLGEILAHIFKNPKNILIYKVVCVYCFSFLKEKNEEVIIFKVIFREAQE